MARVKPMAEAAPEVLRLVGANVRRVREERGWSGHRLARRAGVSATTVSRIERGELSPTLRTLEQLAGAMDVSVASFFSERTLPRPEAVPQPLRTMWEQLSREGQEAVLDFAYLCYKRQLWRQAAAEGAPTAGAGLPDRLYCRRSQLPSPSRRRAVQRLLPFPAPRHLAALPRTRGEPG